MSATLVVSIPPSSRPRKRQTRRLKTGLTRDASASQAVKRSIEERWERGSHDLPRSAQIEAEPIQSHLDVPADDHVRTRSDIAVAVATI